MDKAFSKYSFFPNAIFSGVSFSEPGIFSGRAQKIAETCFCNCSALGLAVGLAGASVLTSAFVTSWAGVSSPPEQAKNK